jgi:hypothetical protein
MKFEIKSEFGKIYVNEDRVGAVFVGDLESCRLYISQRRAKQAIKDEVRRLSDVGWVQELREMANGNPARGTS